MRNRTLWRVLCVVFGLVAVLALLAQLLLAPNLAKTDITRAYDYEATSEDALPTDVPNTIEEDGNSYTRVSDTEKAPVISVVKDTPRYTQTVSLENLTSQQAPETKDFEVGGKTVTLTLESADYTPIDKTYSADGTVEYPNQTVRPDVPDTADVTYENENGDKVTVPGTLVDVISKSGDGTASTNIYSTISLPAGSNIFVLDGKYIAYDPSTPCWDGYQTDVARAAGLRNGATVTGGAWASDPYVEDGMTKRDIIWYVSNPSTDWVATYHAEGTTTVYNATATYGSDIDALGLDASYANAHKLNLSAEVTYRLSEIHSSNPIVKLMSSNALIVPVVGIVAFVLFLVSLFGLIFLSKTKTSKFNHGDIEAEYSEADDEDDSGYDDSNYDEDDYISR